MTTYNRFILLCLMPCLLSLPLTLFTQNAFAPGFVVLNNGDTLHGEIKDRNIERGVLFSRIKFKSETKRRKRYSAHDLISYEVNNVVFESKWFHEQSKFLVFSYPSREGLGEKVFLKLVVKGKVTCYMHEFVDPDNDFVDGFELFQKEGEDFFQRATQGVFGLKKKRLTEYFSDCPELAQPLNRGTFQAASEVADYYNQHCAQ